MSSVGSRCVWCISINTISTGCVSCCCAATLHVVCYRHVPWLNISCNNFHREVIKVEVQCWNRNMFTCFPIRCSHNCSSIYLSSGDSSHTHTKLETNHQHLVSSLKKTIVIQTTYGIFNQRDECVCFLSQHYLIKWLHYVILKLCLCILQDLANNSESSTYERSISSC